MLKVTNIKVYDFAESVVASGYAMGLNLFDFTEDAKTLDDVLKCNSNKSGYGGWFKNNIYSVKDKILEERFQTAIRHIKRAYRLVDASKNSNDVKCHDNFLTGIRVSFDLVYPNYISPEMQRYHFFDIVTSNSKMHRITKMDFDKCCNEYVTQEVKDLMKKYIEEYNSLEDTGDMKYKAFMKVLSNCPQGVELFMRVSTNYKQLQTMYHQRKNHKLKEDWGAFCDAIKTLPFSEWITNS